MYNKKPMCDYIKNLNVMVSGSPSADTVSMVLQFLDTERNNLEPHAWTAVCGPWQDAVDRVFETMTDTLETAWPQFVHAWRVVYAAIKHTCTTTRWMVTQTPPDGPWGGRAICAPTLELHSRVQRSYSSRGECDMALQLLEPQEPAVAITDRVVCSELGCVQQIRWAPKPSR